MKRDNSGSERQTMYFLSYVDMQILFANITCVYLRVSTDTGWEPRKCPQGGGKRGFQRISEDCSKRRDMNVVGRQWSRNA